MHYLGTERYALWLTISSSVAMLTFADLGIGNGLLNSMAECHGKEDKSKAQEYVSSAFFMLTGIAIIMIVVIFAVYTIIPWPTIFSVNSPVAVREAGPAALVFILSFAISLPTGIVARIQMGYQEGFINNIWAIVGNVVGLFGLLLAIRIHARLPLLVIIATAGPILASLGNGTVLFVFKRPYLLPSLSKINKKHMATLLRLGVYFFLIQASLGITVSLDNLVTAHFLGSRAVAQFSVAMRMFSVMPVLLRLTLMPLWPAYGESIARGDISWARLTLIRSLKIVTLLTTVSAAVLFLAASHLLRVWVGRGMDPGIGVLSGIAVWLILTAISDTISVFLNGANVLRIQAFCALALACIATALKWILVPRCGLPAVIWSTNAAYLISVCFPLMLCFNRIFVRLAITEHMNDQITPPNINVSAVATARPR